ncbi:MAG: hypothetical protein ACHQ50_05025 [Fimbriimonadales bacterium]
MEIALQVFGAQAPKSTLDLLRGYSFERLTVQHRSDSVLENRECYSKHGPLPRVTAQHFDYRAANSHYGLWLTLAALGGGLAS